MKIKFMGAAGTVTGSSYILTSGSGKSILIDLGMFQGPEEVEALNHQPYEYDCKQLQAAVLTHAHLDHCGRLPILIQNGFEGSIFMTHPTRDLTELSLVDSAKIAMMDHKMDMYDKDQAYQTIDRFKTVDYHAPTTVGDFTITFHDAGHILGSASLEVEDMHPDSEIKKIIFSGDLGNTPEALVRATEYITKADAVIMESTYGDRLHPHNNPNNILQAEINAVEANGGTLLIPAFALERTQEILHMIMHLKLEGKIKAETPVMLDSPMAEHATQIYMKYRDIFNTHIQADFTEQGTPFSFAGLEVIEKRNDSQDLYAREGVKVIIAGSGMMVGGRIVGHAAHYLTDPANRLLIVGYQGEGTLGREILEGEKEVLIDHMHVDIKSHVSVIETMSSHADQGQLITWLKQVQGVKKLFLTHGEDGPRKALASKIAAELGMKDITMPVLHAEVTI